MHRKHVVLALACVSIGALAGLGWLLTCERKSARATHLTLAPQSASLPPDLAEEARIDARLRRVEAVLATAVDRGLPRGATAWAVMHYLLAIGGYPGTTDKPNTKAGLLLGALPASEAQSPFLCIKDSVVAARGLGAEAHVSQFLSMLCSIGVEGDQIIGPTPKATLGNLYACELRRMSLEVDCSWSLQSTLLFGGMEQHWENKQGEQLSVRALVAAVLAENQRACWGCHRLMSLATAYRVLGSSGTTSDADLRERCRIVLAEALERARMRQLQDGLLAPEIDNNSPDHPQLVLISFTGHSLEWMCSFLPPSECRSDPHVLGSVDGLISAVEKLQREPAGRLYTNGQAFSWGAYCHALRGLSAWKESLAKRRVALLFSSEEP